MSRFSYLAVLAFCIAGTCWLPRATGARVFSKAVRLLLALIPGVVIYTAWDWYAITHKHWSFSPDRLLAIRIGGVLPIEELLFFIVIPIASILTLEAVRAVRGCDVGDEVNT